MACLSTRKRKSLTDASSLFMAGHALCHLPAEAGLAGHEPAAFEAICMARLSDAHFNGESQQCALDEVSPTTLLVHVFKHQSMLV